MYTESIISNIINNDTWQMKIDSRDHPHTNRLHLLSYQLNGSRNKHSCVEEGIQETYTLSVPNSMTSSGYWTHQKDK